MNISRIFCVANFFEPQEIVTTFVFVLHFGIIRPDTFRPMVKLVILSGLRIGQAEEVVFVAAYRRTEPTGFKDGLCQYDFGI